MAEDSDSSNRSSTGSKPLKQDTTAAPSPGDKGVIRHHSGRWGCQIYAYGQRNWLGTFKSKEDAAMAYQSAASKLQVSEELRNLPVSEVIPDELKFQSFFNTQTVLDMIKDGSYPSNFADYLKTRSQSPGSNRGMIFQNMFHKELTPSDVGRLNVLVVPKKFATKFFPPVQVETEENVASKGVQLYFYDRSMKLWKFRYCYRRSKHYLFTTGWSCFVKEKKLKANDTIAFLKCERNGGPEGTSTFYMIDVNPGDSSSFDRASSGLTNPSKQPLPYNDLVEMRNTGTERKGIILLGVDISSTGT